MTARESRAGLPVWAKLLGTMLAGALLLAVRSGALLLAAAAVGAGCVLWRVGARRAYEGVGAGVVWGIAAVAAVAGIVDGPAAGLAAGARLLALLSVAVLLTATTRASDLQDAVVAALRPLERLRLVSADKAGLALSLAIRSLPVIRGAAAEIREAQAARGVRSGAFRLVVPLLARVLRDADATAEAIEARGWPPLSRKPKDTA